MTYRRPLGCGVLLLGGLLLGGCQLLTSPKAHVGEFDLGPSAPVSAGGHVPVRGVEVSAPSWLASQAMQYRLLYDQPAQRHSYADSRWAAPPAELLETALRRSVVPAEASGTGCKLQVDVDELVQNFTSAAESATVIEVRAALIVPRTERLVARKRFAVSRPAPSADARGGVAATSAAVQALSAEIRDWLRQVDANSMQRCAGA